MELSKRFLLAGTSSDAPPSAENAATEAAEVGPVSEVRLASHPAEVGFRARDLRKTVEPTPAGIFSGSTGILRRSRASMR